MRNPTHDYTHQPVLALLSGTLLTTPQGWVVLASVAGYGLLALLIGWDVIAPPQKRSAGASVVGCLSWPPIVFLQFVKQGMPAFSPSWRHATFLAVCAVAPVAYVVYLAHWPT